MIFPATSRVFLLKRSPQGWRMRQWICPVPEAVVTIRAARDKMKGKSEGKGEPAVSFSGKGKWKWRKPNSAKHLQDKLAARKSKSTCHECGQRGHLAGDPQCLGNRDTHFTTWPDDQSFPDREDNRTIVTVERIGQSGVFSSCSNLREHSVCTNSVPAFSMFSCRCTHPSFSCSY